MKLVPIDELESGMRVSKSIYSTRGQILLNSGMKLTDKYIKRLEELNIFQIYISEEGMPDITVPEPISDRTRLEAIKVVRDVMKQMNSGVRINFDQVNQAVGNMLDEILLQNHVIVHLNDIRSYDSYTFHHSVGVTIFSILIALEFGYNEMDIKKIAIGAFLHDVGKIAIDPDIIMKPDQLTEEEYEIVKKHSSYGYDMVRNIEEMSFLSAHVPYQHHEYLDGSGYPRGLKGDEINDFAQIVTVADIYDALISDRVYKNKLMPHQAITIIDQLSNKKLNEDYVEALKKHVAIYPIGSIVKLNTGEIGLVVDVNKENLSQPIIRIIKSKDGKKIIDQLLEVDLIHHDDLEVKDVI